MVDKKEAPAVVTMESLLSQSVGATEINTEIVEVKTENTKTQKINTKKGKIQEVIRGRPKSGRIWKNQKTRFSSIVKTKGIRDKFAKKQALRAELKNIKEASRAIIAARKEEKEKKKERRRENLKRQAENRKKSEVVQVITNTNKIKKMKKKQLRMIEKRDTTKLK